MVVELSGRFMFGSAPGVSQPPWYRVGLDGSASCVWLVCVNSSWRVGRVLNIPVHEDPAMFSSQALRVLRKMIFRQALRVWQTLTFCRTSRVWQTWIFRGTVWVWQTRIFRRTVWVWQTRIFRRTVWVWQTRVSCRTLIF